MKRAALSILFTTLLTGCGGATASEDDGSGGVAGSDGAVTTGGTTSSSGGGGGTTSTGGATPLVSAERWTAWQAEAAPRSGPHEVWSRDDCYGDRLGFEGELIGPELRVVPNVECVVSAELAVGERECRIRATCQTSADCTDGPGGRCEGNPEGEYPFCYYPAYYPAPPPEECSSDADCTQLPGGHCYPQNAVHCYPWRDCLPNVSYCSYDSLFEVGCQSDADCGTLPDGECVRPIRNAVCQYDTCFTDEDCEAGTRCGCGTCIAADCGSDAECGEGKECGLGTPPCGRLTDFHCTTPEDECEPSQAGCIYEDGHFVDRATTCR